MTVRAAVPEESTVWLRAAGPVQAVRLRGMPLGYAEVPGRPPYITAHGPAGVQVRLTDWVGALTFELDTAAGGRTQTLHVYPAKLHPQPDQAFHALRLMAQARPELTGDLQFVAEEPDDFLQAMLGPDLAGLTGGPVDALPLDLPALAAELQALGRRWARLPQPRRSGWEVLPAGAVAGGVDWVQTARHWAAGQFPQHVRRRLPEAGGWPAPLRELWERVGAAARHLPGGPERQQVLRQVSAALDRPGIAAWTPQAQAQLGGAVQDLRGRLSDSGPAPASWPRGHTRMAALYEGWAAMRLAGALGARQLPALQQDAEGQWTAPQVSAGAWTVDINPDLSLQGLGQEVRLRPDLLACRPAQTRTRALVAEVKYRDLNRFTAEQGREVVGQVLRYLGATGAETGLLVWPGLPGREPERFSLPLGGATPALWAVPLHPLDPPGRLTAWLRGQGLR